MIPFFVLKVTVHVLQMKFVRSKMSWIQTTKVLIIYLHYFLFLSSELTESDSKNNFLVQVHVCYTQVKVAA